VRSSNLNGAFLGAAAIALAAFGLFCGLFVRGQTANASVDLPKFAVVAIHPIPFGPHRVSLRFTSDGLSAEGAPLFMVMWQAFGVPNDRIFGAPAWTRSTSYNIEAKVDPADLPRFEKLTVKERWAMVLALCQNRFGLKFHHEKRDLNGYALVIAKGGLKLKESNPTEPGATPSPGTWRFTRSENGYEVKMHQASMADVANMLSNGILGSTIVNKTELTGKYEVTLDYSEEDEDESPATPPMSAQSESPPTARWPSVFTAIQEQLGLKLEPEKEPTDVIVIEQVGKPTPN
jgi:uncharacterized protein (TIGR03435 family)